VPRLDLLVFGGTGLLGSALIDLAGIQHLSVSATHHRREPTHRAADPAWHQIELGEPGHAARLISKLRPVAVINAAYVQAGPDLPSVTQRAPTEMASACALVGSKLVHLSSDIVFDGRTDRPYIETDPVGPVHEYGRAKAAAESLVAAANPTATIVRTSLLWGTDPVGPQGRLVADPSIAFFTDEIRCPLRVDRLASAVLELAFESDHAGLIHVAGADAIDRLTFARLLAPLVGVPAESLRGRPAGRRPDRPADCRLNSNLAGTLLTTPLCGALTDLGG